MDKLLKIIGFIFLGVVILFALLYVSVHAFFYFAMLPEDYSDEEILKNVQKLKIHVPEKATNLCFAATYGIDYANCYFSLTLPDKEECIKFLELLNVSIADFQKVPELPKEYQYIPGGKWFNKFRKKWGISEYKEYYVYDNNKAMGLKVVYVPEQSRIFIFKIVDVYVMLSNASN